MSLNLNTVLTIVALVVAGTSAYFTWQIGTEKQIQSLQHYTEENRKKIEALEPTIPTPEALRKIVVEEVSRILQSNQPRISRDLQYLGEVTCGTIAMFPVPDQTTNTDDWIPLGLHPYINTEFSNDGIPNNALLGFGTTITPTANDKAWKVSFSVRANLATSQHEDIADCNKSTSPSGKVLEGTPSNIHLVALRKSSQ